MRPARAADYAELTSARSKRIALDTQRAGRAVVVVHPLRHVYSLNAHESLPYDGVIETINFLKNKDIKLACITNKPSIFTDKILFNSGLVDSLDLILSGDSLERMKPDPLPLTFSCDYFKIKPNEAIMVGDSINDIEAGLAAETYVVTVPYGYQSGENIHIPKVDFAATTFSDIQSIVS